MLLKILDKILINQNKKIEILTNFSNKDEKNYFIIGIENRLEQVIANLT